MLDLSAVEKSLDELDEEINPATFSPSVYMELELLRHIARLLLEMTLQGRQVKGVRVCQD